MKKLFKDFEWKAFSIPIKLVIIQAFFFFIVKIFQSDPNYIGNAIDDKIPFSVWWIIPYCIWFILLFFVPIYYYYKDKKLLSTYSASYIICALLADVVFLIYPTIVHRPEVVCEDAISCLAHVIFFFDTPPINCLPSMHCAIATLFILSSFSSKKISYKFRIPIFIISIIIMYATLGIKQHVFIDLITGDILMSIVYLIVLNNKKIVNTTKKLLKI